MTNGFFWGYSAVPALKTVPLCPQGKRQRACPGWMQVSVLQSTPKPPPGYVSSLVSPAHPMRSPGCARRRLAAVGGLRLTHRAAPVALGALPGCHTSSQQLLGLSCARRGWGSCDELEAFSQKAEPPNRFPLQCAGANQARSSTGAVSFLTQTAWLRGDWSRRHCRPAREGARLGPCAQAGSFPVSLLEGLPGRTGQDLQTP